MQFSDLVDILLKYRFEKDNDDIYKKEIVRNQVMFINNQQVSQSLPPVSILLEHIFDAEVDGEISPEILIKINNEIITTEIITDSIYFEQLIKQLIS